MPLGIVKDEDYNKSLGIKKEVTPEPEVIREPESIESPDDSTPDNDKGIQEAISSIFNPAIKGRGKGNTEVPNGIRQIIGEAAIKEGSSAASAIGQFLGISQSSVSAYQKGATSTAIYNEPKKELVDHLMKTRQRISKRASGKLLKSLNVIDEDKLEKLDALQASTVAKNMAAIIKHMEPEQKQSNVINGPVITFYAPHMVQEDRFDVITVNE